MRRILAACLVLTFGLMVPSSYAASVGGAHVSVAGLHVIASTTGLHVSAPCGARVAVLGANMSPGGRFEVQRALQVGPHTVQLDETVADERAEAHGLVPPSLFAFVVVSSALLHPLPAGSGLTVTLNPAITLDTAQTYANALLTVGVTDAEVRVAAPTSQRALGATAILGLLRAARIACLTLSSAREDLAIREVVLASELARQVGRPAAPSLLFALKSEATLRGMTAPGALSTLITRTAAARGLTVPASLQPALIGFLHDLVAGGAYSAIARAHPIMTQVSPQQIAVRLAGAVPGRSQPGGRATPPARSASGRSPAPKAGVWQGTVMAVSTTGIAVRRADGIHKYLPAPSVQVYRNGERSSLPALQPGDAITVTTTASGLAIFVQATGASAAGKAAPAHPPAAVVSSDARASNVVGVTIIVAVVLLALLIVPLLIAMWRRRGGRATGRP